MNSENIITVLHLKYDKKYKNLARTALKTS